jgi:hypothetical protein
MDYLFENLGDERFQELCTCIISNEFPNMQAFPVGQPDGGRDTIVYNIGDGPKKTFVVFQVKFVRNANEERDLHKWLEKTIDGEIKKALSLIERGATAYYLLTNVRGTAHLDTGSKDKINKILEEKLPIPSICWWRDDLARIFEKNKDLKWSFPEILNGQDVLNGLLFEDISENRDRRLAVMRAYLTDQYEIDSEVKFKQIDLQNKLLTLFTDVPIRVKKFDEKNRQLKKTLGQIFATSLDENSIIFEEDMGNSVGAASFILQNNTQDHISKILLEGGPGQGKSTISQYVCQVHRIKLLKKIHDLSLLPSGVLTAKTRLPFKIDLRDIAAWIEEKNPYKDVLPKDYFEKNWRNALEPYLLSHVFYHSKLENFESHDLISLIQSSPILFVFDGFDEIADIDLRREVVEFVNKGIQRLSANAMSIQVVITSRPAAFSDAIVFSVDNYPHFELTNITTPIIDEYLGKWIKASKMQQRDAAELKRLVHDKLELPHLRELAKSPMQLAIFITLLRTKGQSLPNKRTALFDSYVSLFFDRESEKSNLIREKRDLIIDIHQYLAWILHSEAERYNDNGSISLENLKIRVREYLTHEGHDSSITDQLFTAMKERVCALVSRVQGTFEFEVQPLREYFCAKYLYTTSQNSTVGDIRPGTKPDRLYAILRNSYWQNVVRFFAGCADAGELDMIIQELKDLQEDDLLKYTHIPRIITSQILSDHVFSQKPKKMREVVRIIINGINIGAIINESEASASSERLILPNECGRAEIVAECFERLSQLPEDDYAFELIGIIKNNPSDNILRWEQVLARFSEDEMNTTTWLKYAYQLQILHKISKETLYSLLNCSKFHRKSRIELFMEGRRDDVLISDLITKLETIHAIVSYEISFVPRSKTTTNFNFLSSIFNPFLLKLSFDKNYSNLKYLDYVNEIIRSGNIIKIEDIQRVDEADQLVFDFAASLKKFLGSDINCLQNDISPWEELVENALFYFGNSWNVCVIAAVSSQIKMNSSIQMKAIDLHDETVSLNQRAQFARTKNSNIKYWQDCLTSENPSLFTFLLYFSFATPRVIFETLDIVLDFIRKISSEDYSKLLDGVCTVGNTAIFNQSQQKSLIEFLDRTDATSEIKYLLSRRFKGEEGDRYASLFIVISKDTPRRMIDSNFTHLMRSFLRKPDDANVLKKIKDFYAVSGLSSGQYYFVPRSERATEMPILLAQEVMARCKEFPRPIGILAESTCRIHANKKRLPVGEVAERDNWFE